MNMLNEMTGTVLTVFTSRTGKSTLQKPTLQKSEFRIITPFANDVFLFDSTKPSEFQKIKLEASKPAQWFVDGQFVGEGKSVLWQLERCEHQIKAVGEEVERVVDIMVR